MSNKGKDLLLVVALSLAVAAITGVIVRAAPAPTPPLDGNIPARMPYPATQTLALTLTITTNGGRDFATPDPHVTLEGTCSPTREVHVNGSSLGVTYPTTVTWWYSTTLWTRDNHFVVTDGVDSRAITIYWDYFHGGTLTDDLTLLTSAHPYTITADVQVSATTTLTIQPGVTLRMEAGRSLWVGPGGQLSAGGAPTRPITFTRAGPDPWGGIILEGSQADNHLRHALVEYAHAAADNPDLHGITALDSRLRVEQSVIRHLYGRGLTLVDSQAHVTGNLIHDIVEDGLYVLRGEVTACDNHIYGSGGDCLDLDDARAAAQRNRLHHCADSGLRARNSASATLTNTLIYTCAQGIAVEDGAHAHILHATIADNPIGLLLRPSQSVNGGFATLINAILWGNGTALSATASSAVTVTYSTVNGGWPGEGNGEADPLFRAPIRRDYRLTANSPSVDAGTPIGAPPDDLDGVPRPQGAGYDQGAYEYRDFPVYLPLVLRNHPPPPPQPPLAVYRLYADQNDLDWLASEPYRDETIPATFVYGRQWDVDLRYRGDTARLMPKKCWKLFLPGSDLFQSQEELNLNADYVDQTLLRSYIGYDLLRRAGVPTPQAGYAPLYINDIYYGLASQVEQIDERFLHRMGIEMHGNLYKPWYGNLGSLDFIEEPDQRAWWYSYHYPKKTNRDSGMEDMIAFIRLINNTPDDQFPAAIAEAMDVNEWLDWYAVNILLGNFEMLEKNYYLYHDFSTDRWIILPWDVDLSLGHNMWGPGIGGLLDTEISWDNPIDSGSEESKKIDGKWNHLIDRMMGIPEFRHFHCRRLQELMADQFSPETLFPIIDAAFETIQPWGEADPNRWKPEGFQFAAGPAELKTYVANRIQFLESQFPAFCPSLSPPLLLNEWMSDNRGPIADEAGDYDPWLELYNTSATLTWDIGGMYLTNDLSDPTRWRIPDDTHIPPQGVVLIWADGEPGEGPLHANFLLSPTVGQIGLFDRDVFDHTPIADASYLNAVPAASYGRWPDGSGQWQYFAAPTPGWLNQGRPPVISRTAHTPTWPTAGLPVTITAVITDDHVNGNGNGDGDDLSATVWYRAFAAGADPPEEYTLEPMRPVGDGQTWQVALPAQPDGVWVEYYVQATDEVDMVTVDRPGWSQGDYRYIVGWQRPPLYLNEVMAINTHTEHDEQGEYDDWVELYNAGPTDLDLGGMTLSDNIGDDQVYLLPAGTIVPAGGYLILWADDDGAGTHLNFKLSGAGEYVGLFASAAGHYAPIDAVYFPPQSPDVSWGRFPDGGEPSWHEMTTPTPGHPNRLHPPQFSTVSRAPLWPGAGDPVTVTAVITAGSPILTATLWYDAGTGYQAIHQSGGASRQFTLPAQPEGTLVQYYLEAVDSLGQRTRYPTAAPDATHRYLVGYAPPTVRINEFLADNAAINRDEAGEYDDWIELYNAGPVTVTLDGMALSDDLSQPAAWHIPAGVLLPPGGHLLIWCDGTPWQGALHTSFRLNRRGEEIGLFADAAHGYVPLDTVAFGPQMEDVSSGRQPDGAETWTFLDPPTPGASNGDPAQR